MTQDIEYLNRLRNDNESLLHEKIKLLKYNRDNIDFIEQDISLEYVCQLELYYKYSTDQILGAWGEHTIDKKKSFREYRSKNSITSPFYFLGKANYVSYSGSKPISIV